MGVCCGINSVVACAFSCLCCVVIVLNLCHLIRHILDEFKLVCNQQKELKTVLDDLRRRKHDLNHKHGRIKAWRKAWNIGQSIAKFGVTVLSVMFPVAGVRAVATTANNGAGGVIGLLQPLVDSHLSGQQSSCEVEIDLTAKILNEACFIFHRVNSTRVLAELLEDQMGLLAQDAEVLAVAVEDEDLAVSMAMDQIKGKALELVDDIEKLEKEVDRSCEDLRRAALTLLQTVTDQVVADPSLSFKQQSLVVDAAWALDKAKMMRFDENSGKNDPAQREEEQEASLRLC